MRFCWRCLNLPGIVLALLHAPSLRQPDVIARIHQAGAHDLVRRDGAAGQSWPCRWASSGACGEMARLVARAGVPALFAAGACRSEFRRLLIMARSAIWMCPTCSGALLSLLWCMRAVTEHAAAPLLARGVVRGGRGGDQGPGLCPVPAQPAAVPGAVVRCGCLAARPCAQGAADLAAGRGGGAAGCCCWWTAPSPIPSALCSASRSSAGPASRRLCGILARARAAGWRCWAT